MVNERIEKNPSGLKIFFEPKSMAVVGASRTPGKIGNTILRNLLKLGFEGQIFPVNPRGEEIEGLRSYASVAAIPEAVELVVKEKGSSLRLTLI